MQPHESPPKLPSNILLHVVDSLRHDLPTLRRCALTSHFLHDYLRPLLCNKVTIAQPWVSRAFELSTFLDDSPSFGALVKHLKIAGPEGTPLERVLAPEGILAVAPKLPAVRTLTLELLAFDYLEDLFHVIAAFPHLETLCINGLLLEDHFETGRLASEEPRFYPTAAAFPPLRSLNIRWGMGYGERPFVRKLLDYKTSLRLQSLVVTFSEVVHQQAPYETYLPDIGESLHHVSISGTSTEHPSSVRLFSPSYHLPGSTAHPNSLASCRSLRSLCIGYPPFVCDLSDRLCALFERPDAPFPQLQALSLLVPDLAGAQIVGEQFPERLAETILHRERYPSFETLTVAIQLQAPMYLQEGSSGSRTGKPSVEVGSEGREDLACAEWMNEMSSLDVDERSDSEDEVRLGERKRDSREDVLARWRALFSAFAGVEGVSLNVTFQDSRPY